MHVAVLACVAILLTVPARALTKLEPPAFRFFSHFHDGVVLQRGGRGSTIAGYAPEGSAISTSLIPGLPPHTVLAGPDGRWNMVLPPVQASKSPVSLVFTNAVKPGAHPIATASLHNVLWGDVFLCRCAQGG